MKTTRAAVISVHDEGSVGALGTLSAFRQVFYRCLHRRADALFELTDSVLCADGPVGSLVGLSLAAEHRRGHGALYDAVNAGRVQIDRLRRELAGLPLPRDGEGRIMLAVDVSSWLRPDAATAPDRLFCHVYGRGKSASQLIPGWPYSFIAALEPGRSSWTAILDAVRLGPTDDATQITADQVRAVVDRLRQAGQWIQGHPAILVIFDAGYDLTRLAWLLRDLPVTVVGRLRSDRVFYLPAAARAPGQVGRPGRHGPVIDLDQPDDHPPTAVSTVTDTTRYGRRSRTPGTGHIRSCNAVSAGPNTTGRCQPWRAPWSGWSWTGCPVTATRNRSGYGAPRSASTHPMWTGCGRPTCAASISSTHSECSSRPWAGPDPASRDPQAADRWTWLIIVVHTQLRLGRDLTADLRRPWERPATGPGRLTPARVRRGFRHLRPKLPVPAGAPKPSRPGPGRPPGSRNKHVTAHPPVGKTQHLNQTTTTKPSKKV